LKILSRPYCSRALSGGALETAAFTIFLYAHMLDDHLNHGRNMDTRTPACHVGSWPDGLRGGEHR